MNIFHDRKRELESLGRSFESSEASLYVLYGRRRLGKTTILRRFADGKPGVVSCGSTPGGRAPQKPALPSCLRGARAPRVLVVDRMLGFRQ